MAIDVSKFMNTQYNEVNATRRSPIPIGEYKAVINKFDLDTLQGKKDPSKTFLKANLVLELDDDGLRQALKRDKVTLPDNFLIDLTPTGDIAFGDDVNVRLGRLRAACGMNNPGQPWSFGQFTGKVIRIKVDHEMYEGEPQARVRAYAPL